MARTIECFYPGSCFPAISITGRACSLNCKHCARKYLEGMIPAPTPADLIEVAEVLAERGASGFLLSGGADTSGRVRLADFVGAIEEIKSTTDLRINAHVGLASAGEVGRLVNSRIDAFSVDVYGADETIEEVLGLHASADDYFDVIGALRNAGAETIAPHICIGVHAGELRGELRAIERLAKYEIATLVLISLMPTKGTAYQHVAPPSTEMILSVIRKAKEELPDTKLLLGCMRSKMNRLSEFDLVSAGLDGIVLPAATTVERLRDDGYVVKKRAVCCSLI